MTLEERAVDTNFTQLERDILAMGVGIIGTDDQIDIEHAYTLAERFWFYRILWFLYYKPVKIAFLQQCYNKRCLIFADIAQFYCAIQFFNRLQNTLVAASMRGLRLTT